MSEEFWILVVILTFYLCVLKVWLQELADEGKDDLAGLRELLAARERIAKQQEELCAAYTGIRNAWEMLSAICESDGGRDRDKARDRAAEAVKRLGAFLSSGTWSGPT